MRYGEVDFVKLTENYDRWWKNDLGRPITPVIFWGCGPGKAEPKTPNLGFPTAFDDRYSPEELLDRQDYNFSCCEFYGDAFPFINMSAFGPGVAAAFMGATPHSADYTIWFDDPRELPLRELHFEYNTDNKWYRRVREFYTVFAQKYADHAIMSMTDLGGMLDILSSFRGADNLLCDLYDEPDEVLRCVSEIQTAWFKYFDDLTSIIAPVARGYSNWDAIYGAKPNYILQCDFSYMIGPEMFAKFVMPELHSSAARLDRTFYHLDGIGELPHLDQLLASEHIKGIQWVYGTGTPELTDWTEVYRRIGAAGKKVHNIGVNLDTAAWATSMLPAPDSLFMGMQGYNIAQKAEVQEKMRRIGF